MPHPALHMLTSDSLKIYGFSGALGFSKMTASNKKKQETCRRQFTAHTNFGSIINNVELLWVKCRFKTGLHAAPFLCVKELCHFKPNNLLNKHTFNLQAERVRESYNT